MSLGDYLEQYTYSYLMGVALSQVSDDIDKRQGSIIFDALSPACLALADAFIVMRGIYQDTYAGTATGEFLDMRAAERGVTRNPATKAVRKGVFADGGGNPVDVVLGTRFSTIGATTYTYSVIEEIITGQYLLECEQTGTGGNSYVGNIIPITYIPPLASAQLLDIVIPGEDTESDDDLRARYMTEVASTAFGGNIADYDKMVKAINGVGDVQVYPIWSGGGTVLLSVVDSTFMPANPAFITILQNAIDPANNSGIGLGLAPIGHKVTVTAPATVPINTTATVTLQGGTNIATAQAQATVEIKKYIDSLREQWGVPNQNNVYSANVYTAQVTSAILRASGIANAVNVMTNNTPTDKLLVQTPARQELPIMGTVTLSL